MVHDLPIRRTSARELGVGETTGPIPVLALLHWNPSRILAEPGQRFLIEADNSVWTDENMPSTAAGIPGLGLQRFATAMCRCRQAGLMELIGALGRTDDHPFRIGRGAVWENRAGISEELFFYANDVYFMYYNNAGSVMVNVTRLA